jgi:hypothetical protein
LLPHAANVKPPATAPETAKKRRLVSGLKGVVMSTAFRVDCSPSQSAHRAGTRRAHAFEQFR